MFELADFLTGIFKVNDCTSSLTIQNEVPTSMLPSSQQPQSTQLQTTSNSIQANDTFFNVARTSPQLSSTTKQQHQQQLQENEEEQQQQQQQQQQTQSTDQQELSPPPTNEVSENFILPQSSDSLPEQLLAAEDENLEEMT